MFRNKFSKAITFDTESHLLMAFREPLSDFKTFFGTYIRLEIVFVTYKQDFFSVLRYLLFFLYCTCVIQVRTLCKGYEALLRTPFRRHDFIAYVLYLIVAGIVKNFSIVTQIGTYVWEKVSFTQHENLDFLCKFNFMICRSYYCNG